ncbi:hypothetical protein HZA57_09120, partial [Candidatus Poribacteria bacterium]|nr:hypothetical protein [Candidatus Poribacteria bacterium]
ESLPSIPYPPWTLNIWEPAVDVVVSPGRTTALTAQQQARLSEGSLKVVIPGGGRWTVQGLPADSNLLVNGVSQPAAHVFDAPSTLPVTLALHGPAPDGSVAFRPDWSGGEIACPGGLPSHAMLDHYSHPQARNGNLSWAFERNLWAEYTFDVPADGPCTLRTDFRCTGENPGLLEVTANGQTFAILLGRPGIASEQQFLPLPEKALGERVVFRYTFMSETLQGDNRLWLDSVALLRALPPPDSHDNVLAGLSALPPPAWAAGTFPPPEGTRFWSLSKFDPPEGHRWRREVREDGIPAIMIPVERNVPSFRTQIAFPPINLQGSGAIYASYEAIQRYAPQHSFGVFAALLDKSGKILDTYSFTEHLQGQENKGQWCRYAGLIPYTADHARAIFYGQVYRHPEDTKPPTPEGSEFGLRRFTIHGPPRAAPVPSS